MSRAFAAIAILALFSCHRVCAQFLGGWIAGRVQDEQSLQGIENVRILISGMEGEKLTEVFTDASGSYLLLALDPGQYQLRFQSSGYLAYIIRSVRVQSGRASFVDLRMRRATKTGDSKAVLIDWQGEPINQWGTSYGTVFERWQLDSLPSPRNIWALLENQEISTVTNRVDEGGIATGTIALVGSHGSSWTQNGYRFEGINITDPFQTGKPLIYPDYGSLQEFQAATAVHPSAVSLPGASFNMTSRQASGRFHAEAQGYYLGDPLQSSNLDDRLRRFGFATTPHFKRFSEGQLVLSGALPRSSKWCFLTSLGAQHLSKVIPDFNSIPTATVYSGLLRFDGMIRPKDLLRFVASGQIVNNSNLGARPGVSPSATLRGNDRFQVLQGRWMRRQSPEAVWQLSFGFSHASLTDTFQRGISEPNRTELFTDAMTGAAPLESDSARSRFSVLGQGQMFRRIFGEHLLDFGFDLEESLATEERRVFQNLRLIFFPRDAAAQVIRYNTPARTKHRLREFSLFLDDHLRISDRLFLRLGLTLDASKTFLAAQQGGVVSWKNLAPRLSLTTPALKRFGDTRLTVSFSRYYHLLPARYAGFADPNSLGGQVFAWEDENQDGQFQPGEQGRLLRVFGGPFSSLDPQLRRPLTDEWGLGVDQLWSRRLQISARLFRRDEKRLVETVNVGVPPSAFTPVEILDLGDDNKPGTSDDQVITVFNQDPSTLGQDRFLLTNPQGFRSFYKGLEVVIRKGLVRSWFLSIAFTAYKAVGSSSPGNSEFENDTGVIGSLFDDPNTLLNARGRLFFDRAFVGKVAGYGRAPLGFYFGSVVKYFDGLPFGRRLIITGFNQGPFFVMATPRGQPGGVRTQFNLTFDQRLGRDFNVGRSKLSLMIDIFNLLNLNKNTREFDISGPLFPLRRPLDVQNPRVFRFGLRWNL